MSKHIISDKPKKRESNIELLRIIIMLAIVAHHFSVHSGFNFVSSNIGINRLWIQFIRIGGKIGVDIFILISGYYLIKSKKSKISKIIKLWVQIFTYSLLLYFMLIKVGVLSFSIKELLKHIFPITYSQWGFASVYLILYILSPYLNKLLLSLNKGEYQKLLLTVFLFWSVIPTFLFSSFQGNTLIWYMSLYILGAYINLYFKDIKLSRNKCGLITGILLLLTFGSAVFFDLLGLKIAFFSEHATFFYGMQKLPIFLISVFVFLTFLKIKIKYNKIINTFAKGIFGVYLIHDFVPMRKVLWQNIFRSSNLINSNMFILYSIGVILLVFAVCLLIELLRIYLFENNYLKFINKISIRLERFMNKKIKQ